MLVAVCSAEERFWQRSFAKQKTTIDKFTGSERNLHGMDIIGLNHANASRTDGQTETDPQMLDQSHHQSADPAGGDASGTDF